MRKTIMAGGLVIAAGMVATASGDQFGSGANLFSIDFVRIAAPGNSADTTGVPNPAGSVPYVYRIGKYEISEQMIEKANALGDLGITKDTRGLDKPATGVSWFEAAQFVNWLNTSTGGSPAYKFDGSGEFHVWAPGDAGYDSTNPFRNSRARYFLPSADEWYKAAFYDLAAGMYFAFPNGSNIPPLSVINGTAPNTAVWNTGTAPADIYLAGGPSPFGTVAQAGNVWEWQESARDWVNDEAQELRALRGSDTTLTINDIDISSSFVNESLPWRSLTNVGLRVAAVVPEPTSIQLFAVAVLAVSAFCRRTVNGR